MHDRVIKPVGVAARLIGRVQVIAACLACVLGVWAAGCEARTDALAASHTPTPAVAPPAHTPAEATSPAHPQPESTARAFAGKHSRIYLPSKDGPNPMPANPAQTQTAYFAAGCFWGVEEILRTTPGVLLTEVGYTGGRTQSPTYKQVCYEETGHAEAVRVVFDPAVISYEQLVEFFFKLHDPTQVNRQGPDIGDQYRSAIFFVSPEQEQTARAVVAKLTSSKKFRRPIATQIVESAPWWPAEEYHQRYFFKRGIPPTCHFVAED